ncbi:hypothetical protein BCR34DRAFT_97252 [Clohesyomyces aquaticus]|uniref:Uncharacterized protein n=1 Tax=Clohesyomyces aquaticus TaxID=1231657 RepID=A0A1Y2A279_9PLEO|nr:hypothetical protein BCR34DRAFT_97252 [Clohesyomyces aquaticus]
MRIALLTSGYDVLRSVCSSLSILQCVLLSCFLVFRSYPIPSIVHTRSVIHIPNIKSKHQMPSKPKSLPHVSSPDNLRLTNFPALCIGSPQYPPHGRVNLPPTCREHTPHFNFPERASDAEKPSKTARKCAHLCAGGGASRTTPEHLRTHCARPTGLPTHARSTVPVQVTLSFTCRSSARARFGSRAQTAMVCILHFRSGQLAVTASKYGGTGALAGRI